MKITNDGDNCLDSASLGDIFAPSLHGEEVLLVIAAQRKPMGVRGKRLK